MTPAEHPPAGHNRPSVKLARSAMHMPLAIPSQLDFRCAFGCGTLLSTQSTSWDSLWIGEDYMLCLASQVQLLKSSKQPSGLAQGENYFPKGTWL